MGDSFDAVLRVGRKDFDVDAFLDAHPEMEPVAVWRQGEERFPRSRGPSTTSGFNAPLGESESPDELAHLVEAALTARDAGLARLRETGVDVHVDVGLIVQPTAVFPSYMFTVALLDALSRRGLALEVTFYPGAEDDEEPEGPAVH